MVSPMAPNRTRPARKACTATALAALNTAAPVPPFGPATPLRFRRGDTEYVLSWFPLGGYVMMASEEETSDETGTEAQTGSGPRSLPTLCWPTWRCPP
ncbi:MAG: site-2 protease family protein [Gemmatimonadetes bacterium]|nr:site-2 protease family protein [Gemmatimonadota bacterium]